MSWSCPCLVLVMVLSLSSSLSCPLSIPLVSLWFLLLSSPCLLLLSCCFGLHPFPPHEQLLMVVVGGCAVVVGLSSSFPCSPSSSLLACHPHCWGAGGCWIVPLPCILVFCCPIIVGLSLLSDASTCDPPCEQLLTGLGVGAGSSAMSHHACCLHCCCCAHLAATQPTL